MLQPADILLLDEPANDPDIPTLEVLEESLEEFPGAIVLITHDRFLSQLQDPGIMCDADRLAEIYAEHQEAQKKVEQLYERWEELEALSRG